MSAVCFLVAGTVAARISTAEFSLEWQHSVEKTRWEERYRVDAAKLVLTSASIEGMGAGMEPPPDARFANGRWIWTPMRSLSELRLTESRYARDYVVCWGKRCSPLAGMISSPAETIVARAC